MLHDRVIWSAQGREFQNMETQEMRGGNLCCGMSDILPYLNQAVLGALQRIREFAS